jgi:hypothetical protein
MWKATLLKYNCGFPLSNLHVRYIELALLFLVTDKYPAVDTTPACCLPRDHSEDKLLPSPIVVFQAVLICEEELRLDLNRIFAGAC